MQKDSDKSRIDSINKMIIELSSGNFLYSIERTGKRDDLETSIMLLNMMAEEMRAYFRHKLYVHPNHAYKHIAEMSFILNSEFRIIAYSPSVPLHLKIGSKDLIKKKFESLITLESTQKFEKSVQDLGFKNQCEEQLNFEAGNGLTITAWCSISKLLQQSSTYTYSLIAMQTVAVNDELENAFYNRIKNRTAPLSRETDQIKILKRESDLRKIKAVYHYILEHLEEPLMSLKELARHFGTNEFKLKQGFRQLYNTSVFRFQTEERLKKAHLLIRDSEMSLKTICNLTGFKSYPHFSKTFRKRFGYNPSELQKQVFEEN